MATSFSPNDEPTKIERSPFERMREQQERAVDCDRAERERIKQDQRSWERDERNRAERERDRWRS